MIVQVEPKVTTARLSEILATIESAWPELSDYAVAHAFGDPHGPLQVGDRSVRYIPPEAIAGNDRARVVLFKSALTTGWDCPRAEVLVSFQGKDSADGRRRRPAQRGDRLPARLPDRERLQRREVTDRGRDRPGRGAHRAGLLRAQPVGSAGAVRATRHASVVHARQDRLLDAHRPADAPGRGAERARSRARREREGTAVDGKPGSRGRRHARQRDRCQGRGQPRAQRRHHGGGNGRVDHDHDRCRRGADGRA